MYNNVNKTHYRNLNTTILYGSAKGSALCAQCSAKLARVEAPLKNGKINEIVSLLN